MGGQRRLREGEEGAGLGRAWKNLLLPHVASPVSGKPGLTPLFCPLVLPHHGATGPGTHGIRVGPALGGK